MAQGAVKPFVLQEPGGNVGIGITGPQSALHVKGSADQPQFLVQAHSSQTSPIVQWQTSSGSNLGAITGAGNLALGDIQTYGARQYTQASLSPGGLSYGQYIYAPSSLSANSGTSLYSLYAELNHNGGNFNHTGNLYGFGFRAKNLTSGAGTVNNLYGAAVAVANQSAAASTSFAALSTQYQSLVAGAITNVYHFLVDSPLNSAPSTVTNAYGLYIQPLTFATNNYGIYQSGANERNYFAGAVGVGTSTGIYKLDVQGAANGAVIRAQSNTANDILFFGTGTVTGDLKFFDASISATGNVVLNVANTNSASATANTQLSITTNNSAAGDPWLAWVVLGQQAYSAGIDNSDSDKFKLGPNNNPSSGTTAFVMDTAGNIGVGTASPQSTLQVPDGKYAQFSDNNVGAPPSADCDSAEELGRQSVDTANLRLYVCLGAAGWKYASLQ